MATTGETSDRWIPLVDQAPSPLVECTGSRTSIGAAALLRTGFSVDGASACRGIASARLTCIALRLQFRFNSTRPEASPVGAPEILMQHSRSSPVNGELVRHRRHLLGLSQDGLAEREVEIDGSTVKLGKSTIQRAESGDSIGWKSQRILAALLDLTVEQLQVTHTTDAPQQTDEVSALHRTALRETMLEVFHPWQPLSERRLVQGRNDAISLIESINRASGRHALLYGERSVGKTSAARVGMESLRSDAFRTVWIDCEFHDEFTTIGASILSSLGIAAPTSSLRPRDLTDSLRRLETHVVVFLDEVERLNSDAVNALVDCMKQISNHGVPASFVLIGVEGTATRLVDTHASSLRGMTQTRIGRLKQPSLRRFLRRAADRLSLDFTNAVIERIVWLSRGLPFFCHLAGRHAALQAIGVNKNVVDYRDLENATPSIVDEARGYLTELNDTSKLLELGIDPLVALALLAALERNSDRSGWFGLSGVDRISRQVLGRGITAETAQGWADAFCSGPQRRAQLERRSGVEMEEYRFVNPQLEAYALVHLWDNSGRDPFSGFVTSEACQRCGRTWIDLELSGPEELAEHQRACTQYEEPGGEG